MAQYISKFALVAEIEKLIDEIYAGRPFDSLSSEQQTALWYVKSIMSSINTLEVKEVDLKKELESFFYPHVPWGDYCKNEQEDIEEWSFKIAKHFFELGIKASQKGEEV
jgi:hypothetical protein